MSIATDHEVRQLLKRVATLEQKVKAMEAVQEALVSQAPKVKSLVTRAKAAVTDALGV
jgi:hypothetical protein